jgi:hypothetical protein
VGAYKEEFPAGTTTRIIGIEDLMQFARSWKFHHPLEPEQLKFAGHVAEVEGVSFYHGGDALYKLRGLPGLWHEQCLQAAKES